MATLHTQPPRSYVRYSDVKDRVRELKKLLGADLSTEVALETVVKLMELDFNQQDRDAKDEQLSGFGSLLDRLVEVLDR